MDDLDRKISDQLVRLIQIFFGFVLAQSLSRYAEVVLDPLSKNHFIAAFALLTIFTTTILSWIDWHITMGLRPYNLSPKNNRRIIDELRLLSDILIVIFYAYILLAIENFSTQPNKSMSQYLWGFFLVFLGYFFSGWLRQKSYGSLASKLKLIDIFGGIYFILALLYKVLFDSLNQGNRTILNFAWIFLALITMVAYRWTRRTERIISSKNKLTGLKIGIDVDGVLANQIIGAIPKIKRRLGITLSYESVTEWNLPVGKTSIDQEISLAMEDQEYVLSMPSHPFASRVVNELYKNHSIVIITARPSQAEEWTKLWLLRAGISFDSIKSVKEMKKSQLATDILIDDYIGNIREYLDGTIGFAILLDQPWNRNRSDLSHFIYNGRLSVISSLRELPDIVKKIQILIRVD
jgi:5'(3')-deoxyribonucleotidase